MKLAPTLFRIPLKASVIFILLSGSAVAQSSAIEAGMVSATGGDRNAVLMLRGNEILPLSEGDRLLEGDRVFTRTNGSATLSLNGCVKELQHASFLQINSEACGSEPFRLYGGIANDDIGDNKGTGVAPSPTSFDLALLASGGGASAYQGTSDNPVRAFGP